MDRSYRGSLYTSGTHFIIIPRQKQMSMLKGPYAPQNKSSEEESWVGGGRMVSHLLVSCSLRALFSNDLPKVLRLLLSSMVLLLLGARAATLAL